jgi:hypothetical protein
MSLEVTNSEAVYFRNTPSKHQRCILKLKGSHKALAWSENVFINKLISGSSRLADLYLIYAAWARSHSQTPASAETFRYVWRSGWDKTLYFRKTSCHSLCFTCGQLKSQIRNADELGQHISACSSLVTHLRDQWRDRAVYWSLRARARTEGDVLALIGDGMDKSKFGIPQWEGGRTPKHSVVDHNNRPSCCVYAVLAHGFRVDVYITNEGMSTGPSFCCDMLLRTIDGVWGQCQRAGKAFPLDVTVQGDNTTKELKNSIIARTLAMLASSGLFRATAHMHLRVGHTHEDIDQFFGLVARTDVISKPPPLSILVLCSIMYCHRNSRK